MPGSNHPELGAEHCKSARDHRCDVVQGSATIWGLNGDVLLAAMTVAEGFELRVVCKMLEFGQ